MNFDEYQKRAQKYDFFAPGFSEKILGLAGESGEAADKVKKIIRDHQGQATAADRTTLIKELGDVLWYLASLARYLDTPLSQVAEENLAKLESRYQRNKLHGSGDER